MTEKANSTTYSLSLQKAGVSDPDLARRLQIYVQHDIVDRWEGMAETVEIWGSQPNVQFISRQLTDADTRLRAANVFVRRETVTVIEQLVKGIRQVRPSDVSTTKEHVISCIRDLPQMDDVTASIVGELMLPVLIEKGMVNANMSYSKHIRYGFGRVDVSDIALDVAMHQVSQAVDAARASSINKDTKYSVRPLCEALGEALRPIGLALLDVNELTPIVEDMVKGVRAHLDPSGAVTPDSGSVPRSWREHQVVEELSKNLVFVRAALTLSDSTRLSLVSEGWRLEKWAPIILSAIKSSSRYAWIGKAEALRHYTLRKVRDNSGMPVCSVLSRDMRAVPVAQTVFAVRDAIMATATNINATKDRIAEAVQVAYGRADFSVDMAASMFADLLTDAVEAGWVGSDAVYSFGAPLRSGEQAAGHASDVAALLSERLYVEVDENGVVVDDASRELLRVITEANDTVLSNPSASAEDHAIATANLEEWSRLWRPKWWFVVPTKERNLRIWSGVHHGTEVVTSDPSEALLAATEFSAVDALPARAQVLGPKAFSSRVIDFDLSSLLQRLTNRFSFDITVNDVSMRGTLSAQEFGSLKSGVYTSLVVPSFNAEVIEQAQTVFETAKVTLDRMRSHKNAESMWLQGNVPGAPFFAFVERRVARELLQLAQKLSPAFRTDVHRAIVERSVLSSASVDGKIGPDDAMVLRARLHQKTFAACADLVALQFFLDIQGLRHEGWTQLVNSEELVRVCMELGSDREVS